MSRQFFIQFKRHFPFLEVIIILMYNSALRLNLADSGSGRQPLRMGTTKSARRKGLASAGAGFIAHIFVHPTSLNWFSP